MIQDRVCISCNRKFKGGPRAYYCPECRIERIRSRDKNIKNLKMAGLNPARRNLGSIDICERCGDKYVVTGGLQRFCHKCMPIHRAEYDRTTSIDFYHQNASKINPIRNEKRHIKYKKCLYCGKKFDIKGTAARYCSNDCRSKARALRKKEKKYD